MLPKDYIAYKLSGVHCTDVSDASGMLIFDVENRCWSKEMIDICGIKEEQLAKVFESYEIVGNITDEIANFLEDMKIVPEVPRDMLHIPSPTVPVPMAAAALSPAPATTFTVLGISSSFAIALVTLPTTA